MFADYELADLLAYDSSIWLALVERYLLDWWPLSLFWPAGLILAWWAGSRACRGTMAAPWPVLIWLALAWAWVAWAFHLQQHQTLNWAAGYWALAWFVQSALLLLVTLASRRTEIPGGAARRFVVPGLSLLLPPVLGWLLDDVRPGRGDMFGMTPDATALTTLAIVAGLRGRWALGWMLLLAVIPLAALIVSALFGRVLGLTTPALLAALGVGLVLNGLLLAARRAADRPPR